MLLFKRKVIETEEPEVDIVENKNGTTIKDGLTSFDVVYGKGSEGNYIKNDIVSDIKRYCVAQEMENLEHLNISYVISSNCPTFGHNEEYFRVDLDKFQRRWYLAPNAINKGHAKESDKLKRSIEEELVAKGWLVNSDERHKKPLTNIFTQSIKEEKTLKDIFMQTIEFAELNVFFRQVATIDFLHFPSNFNYTKVINQEKGSYDLLGVSEKELEDIRSIIDNETKKRLDVEKEFWFEHALKRRPLVKFWLTFEHARTKMVELDETTTDAILKFNQAGQEELQYEDGVLCIAEISEEELNDFFTQYNIVYNDVLLIQDLVQSAVNDRYVVQEYKYYKIAAEQQEIINNKIVDYNEEKKQKKENDKPDA